MFRRRDIPPLLLLLLLIVLVMVILSQILFMQSGAYNTNTRRMRRLQRELRDMDAGLRALMSQKVPSIELNRRLLQNSMNTAKFDHILELASRRETLRDAKSMTSLQQQPMSQSTSPAQNNNVTLRTNSPLGKATTTVNRQYQSTSASDSDVDTRKTAHHDRYCTSIPPALQGKVSVSITRTPPDAYVQSQNTAVLNGGQWRPSNCVARHKVALVIPYRDRQEHLLLLLSYLHPILQRQQLDYRIFVVEQHGDDTFNKARIMNIGFVEALKQYRYQCFVFHDVDLVPEDDRNMYSCPVQPRHMSVAIDEMGYKLAYEELVGGVLSMRTAHFQKLNGYSNLYWGWGAEDDDMAYRIMHVGLKITRPPAAIARYKMIKHTKRKPSNWRKRAKLLYTVTRRFQFDGLNSLQYRLVDIRNRPLYTHITAEIGLPPKGF